jgi:hypothetical protein
MVSNYFKSDPKLDLKDEKETKKKIQLDDVEKKLIKTTNNFHSKKPLLINTNIEPNINEKNEYLKTALDDPTNLISPYWGQNILQDTFSNSVSEPTDSTKNPTPRIRLIKSSSTTRNRDLNRNQTINLNKFFLTNNNFFKIKKEYEEEKEFKKVNSANKIFHKKDKFPLIKGNKIFT